MARTGPGSHYPGLESPLNAQRHEYRGREDIYLFTEEPAIHYNHNTYNQKLQIMEESPGMNTIFYNSEYLLIMILFVFTLSVFVNGAQQNASETERQIAEALRNPSVSKNDVLRLIQSLPRDIQFIMKDTWKEMSRSDSLEDWRKLESYKLLVNRCISYPCDFEYFVSEVIISMGINKNQIVDMTMGQYLPIDREENDKILMANLPFTTSIGPASIYFAVSKSTGKVEKVMVFPDSV